VDDTREIINHIAVPRSHPPRPPWLLSEELHLPGSRGAMGWGRTRAFAQKGSRAILPPGGAPPPPVDGPSIIVAYPLLANSRLGCSPNLGWYALYHTTSCQSRRNTNQGLDKKSGGLPASPPAARFGRAHALIGPGAQRPQLFPRSGKRWRIAAGEFPPLSAFIIAPSKKRTNICLILCALYLRS
jgi:hypothetical protein